MNTQSFLKSVLFLLTITTPAAAQVPAAAGIGMTPGRAAALLPVAMGLISVVIGGLALRSVSRIGSRQRGAILAMAMAVVGIVLSVLHLARATGAIGTGSGKLGGIVALVLGVIGTVLGWMALARLKRIAKGSNNRL